MAWWQAIERQPSKIQTLWWFSWVGSKKLRVVEAPSSCGLPARATLCSAQGLLPNTLSRCHSLQLELDERVLLVAAVMLLPVFLGVFLASLLKAICASR